MFENQLFTVLTITFYTSQVVRYQCVGEVDTTAPQAHNNNNNSNIYKVYNANIKS